MFGRSCKKLIEEIAKLDPKMAIQVNCEKPGKGNFIVSVGDQEVLALRALPRPFKALRECDLSKVAQDVIDAAKGRNEGSSRNPKKSGRD